MSEDPTQMEVPAPPQPAADLAALDRLVGTWDVSDPSGGGAVSGTVRYEWMEGRHFLLQHVELEQYRALIRGIEVIGHERPFGAEEPNPLITSRYYDSMGNTFDYTYEIEGDTLTIWAGEPGSPAHYRGTFEDGDARNAGAWTYPGGGGYASAMMRVR